VQAKHLLDRHPRIDVLLLMVGANDFLNRLALDRAYVPLVSLKEMGAGQLRQLQERAFAEFPNGNEGNFWVGGSELLRRLRRIGQRREVSARLRPVVQDEAGAVYETWRRHREEAPRVRERLPDLKSALEEFRRNLEAIVEEARRHEVLVMLVTQASLWRPDLEPEALALLWAGGVGNFMGVSGADYYSVEALAEGMALYNDVLLGVCRERRVSCVDLAATFPKETAYFYDDLHFTERGSAKVAETLAPRVAELRARSDR
jgi:lysophospholipase L1-like esterase